MKKRIAKLTSTFSIFGTINPPADVGQYGSATSGGLTVFLGNILKTGIALGSVYALFNFVFAGYMFISAGGDPKKIADAWAKIYQTFVGLVIATGAFLIAAFVSRIAFGNPTDIFRLRIFTP
jgi:hypothetical protein